MACFVRLDFRYVSNRNRTKSSDFEVGEFVTFSDGINLNIRKLMEVH